VSQTDTHLLILLLKERVTKPLLLQLEWGLEYLLFSAGRLRREADTAHQLLQAWVGAQRNHSFNDLQEEKII
jgi:hypothetical protein